MKKLFLFKTILVLSIIIIPAMASAFNISENTVCSFTTPVNLGSFLAPDYEYSQENCSTTYTWPDTASTSNLVYTIPYNNTTATSGSSTALIDSSWTFGELFIAFLMVFFIGYTLIKDILRFFFPDKIRVLRIKDAL